jgi:membrane protein
VFRQGDNGLDLYYMVSGNIELVSDGRVIRELAAGDYFGEMSLLTNTPRIADAFVKSELAEVVVVSAENIETLLLGEPKVAMNFLKVMATRLQDSHRQAA